MGRLRERDPLDKISQVARSAWAPRSGGLFEDGTKYPGVRARLLSSGYCGSSNQGQARKGYPSAEWKRLRRGCLWHP
jgi:hypothetical protein